MSLDILQESCKCRDRQRREQKDRELRGELEGESAEIKERKKRAK